MEEICEAVLCGLPYQGGSLELLDDLKRRLRSSTGSLLHLSGCGTTLAELVCV